ADLAGTPENGVSHDFIKIDGTVANITTINLSLTGTPVDTTGPGLELIQASDPFVNATSFHLAGGSLTYADHYYWLNYVANYSGSDEPFSLRSTTICAVDGSDNPCLIASNTPQFLAIDALDGSDTLQFGGDTNFSFDSSLVDTTYTNFEHRQKTGASNVTLT